MLFLIQVYAVLTPRSKLDAALCLSLGELASGFDGDFKTLLRLETL